MLFVNTINQFVVKSRQINSKAIKHVLQNLKGTIHYGLRYVGDGELMLHGFVDYEQDAKDRKGVS